MPMYAPLATLECLHMTCPCGPAHHGSMSLVAQAYTHGILLTCTCATSSSAHQASGCAKAVRFNGNRFLGTFPNAEVQVVLMSAVKSYLRASSARYVFICTMAR